MKDKVQISSNINCFTFLNYDDEAKCQFKQPSILVIYSVPSRRGGGGEADKNYHVAHILAFICSIIIFRLHIQINLSDEVQIALKLRDRARHIFLYINTNIL